MNRLQTLSFSLIALVQGNCAHAAPENNEPVCAVSIQPGTHGGFFVRYTGETAAGLYFYGLTRPPSVPMESWKHFYSNAFQLTLLPGTSPKEYKKSREGQIFVLISANPIEDLEYSYRIKPELGEPDCCENSADAGGEGTRNATVLTGGLSKERLRSSQNLSSDLPKAAFCPLRDM